MESNAEAPVPLVPRLHPGRRVVPRTRPRHHATPRPEAHDRAAGGARCAVPM